MNYLLNILLVFGVSVVVVIGDILLKQSTLTDNSTHKVLYIIGGILVYIATAFGFIHLYKVLPFSNAGVIYAIVSILLFVIVGLVLYKESVNIYEFIGVVLAVISVILMARFA